MAGTPGGSAAGPSSAARTSRLSPCADTGAASGRIPRELTEYSRQPVEASFGRRTAKYRELGTATNLLTFNRLGALPTRNFQSGTFDAAVSISPERCAPPQPHARQLRRLHHRVRAHLRIGDEPGVRLEYESLFAPGLVCGVSDPNAVLALPVSATILGLDTISAGGTIAFAMECVERGWLDEPGSPSER
jgi:aldehyde:ferredoxin oxidoreductase